MPRGRITKTFTVWCGKCANWTYLDVPAHSTPVKAAKGQGYKVSKEFGWLCPECTGTPAPPDPFMLGRQTVDIDTLHNG